MNETRSPVSGWIVALSVALPSSVLAQESRPTQLPVAAILLDEMEMSDGHDADTMPAVKIEGTCEFHIEVSGQATRRMEGEYVEYYDGKKAYHCSQLPGFKIEEGCDGEFAWEIDPMAGASLLVGARRATKERIWGLTRGEGWRAHYADAECTGTADVEGKSCWVLRMTPKTGKDETWYIDRDSSQLARLDLTMHTPNGEQDVTVVFEEWKRIETWGYSALMTIHADPVTIVFTADKATYGADVPADVFDLPPVIADIVAERAAVQPPPEEAEQLEVTITEIAARPVMSIRVKVAVEKIGETLGVCIPEVYKHLNDTGATPMGPPFSRFYSFKEGVMDVEAGFPVAAPLEETKRIKANELPGGKVATAVHIGHFEKIGETHTRLEKWLKEHGHQTEDIRWEVYWTDPGREPDPTKWRTQLFWKLAEPPRLEPPAAGFEFGRGHPKVSPFSAMRPAGDGIEVRVDGDTWYELVSINDIPAEKLVGWCKRHIGEQWWKRITEDLVGVLAGTGNAPAAHTADLELRNLTSGTVIERQVLMTEAKRDLLRDANSSK